MENFRALTVTFAAFPTSYSYQFTLVRWEREKKSLAMSRQGMKDAGPFEMSGPAFFSGQHHRLNPPGLDFHPKTASGRPHSRTPDTVLSPIIEARLRGGIEEVAYRMKSALKRLPVSAPAEAGLA